MAPRITFGQFHKSLLALVILSPSVVCGGRTTLSEDDVAFHFDNYGMNGGGGVFTRRPWEDRHPPPPIPTLPPMPPTVLEAKFRSRNPDAEEFSVCTLRACSCKNRTKDGEELVDISCNCAGTHIVVKIWEGMLPEKADTLEISDCDLVRLGGVDSVVGETSEERGQRGPGHRGSRRNLKNLSLERRKREEARVGAAEAEAAGGDEGEGVEWEEAVWEAELGSPDDEDDQETDPPEEEEEDTTPEGEESEKGGRYARAAPESNGSRPLSSLIIRRVRELRMKSHAVGPVRSVLLEDVMVVPSIPPYAFQPPPPGPSIHPSGYSQAESIPHGEAWEMESVTLRNVSEVKRFSENSFSNVLIKSHFIWYRTNVVIMEMNAIRVAFSALDEDDFVDPCETSYRARVGRAKEAEVNATTSSQSPGAEQGGDTIGASGLEGLKTACEATQGVFAVTDSVISMWGMNAFGINGARSVAFSGCIATSLTPFSIFVGSANFFSFTRNSVLESVSAYAFSVTASFVEFRRNRFGRLQENSLSGVKPMPSKISFGLPHLAFEDNLLIDVDLLSLHPSWDISMFRNKSEDHDSDGYSFVKNAFADCSCPHLGWIVQVAGEEESSANFYTHLLDSESGNYCVKEPIEPMGFILPCRLPLSGISSLFEDDGITCKRHVDVVKLCELYSSAASRLICSIPSQIVIILVPWAIYSILMTSLFRITT